MPHGIGSTVVCTPLSGCLPAPCDVSKLCLLCHVYHTLDCHLLFSCDTLSQHTHHNSTLGSVYHSFPCVLGVMAVAVNQCSH